MVENTCLCELTNDVKNLGSDLQSIRECVERLENANNAGMECLEIAFGDLA